MINNRRVQLHDHQRGFTLIEVLVAMTLTGLILAAVSATLILVLRTPPKTVEHLGSSDSAFRTGSTFADDVASATPETGQLTVARGAPGCGGDTNSVLRILTTAGDEVEVRSYSVVDDRRRLERRICRGADKDAALAAPVTSARTVVTNLVDDIRPSVTCQATASAAPAPDPPAGDVQCRLVSMTVTTTGNLVFTVDGRRETVQSPLNSPVATETSCTLGIGSDTYVDSWHKGGAPGEEKTFSVQAKTGGVRLNSYIKFDLLTSCLGGNEPAYLPGGKQLTSAELRLTLVQKDQANLGTNPNDAFRLVVLPGWYNWNEDLLKFNDLLGCGEDSTPDNPNPLSYPCEYVDGVQVGSPDMFYNFNLNVDPGPPPSPGQSVNIEVLGAVQRWYDGTEVNQGWTLDRGYYRQNDRGENNAWKFASRENANESIRPKLVLKWD